jgi:hypothetical protein
MRSMEWDGGSVTDPQEVGRGGSMGNSPWQLRRERGEVRHWPMGMRIHPCLSDPGRACAVHALNGPYPAMHHAIHDRRLRPLPIPEEKKAGKRKSHHRPSQAPRRPHPQATRTSAKTLTLQVGPTLQAVPALQVSACFSHLEMTRQTSSPACPACPSFSPSLGRSPLHMNPNNVHITLCALAVPSFP